MTLDEISKLSNDELRVKVAELRGWGITENLGSSGGVLARQPNGQTLWDQAYLNKHQALVNEAPNFPGSRDAMAEAEESLTPDEWNAYMNTLEKLPCRGEEKINPSYLLDYRLSHTEAKTKAIAFIATKEGVR